MNTIHLFGWEISLLHLGLIGVAIVVLFVIVIAILDSTLDSAHGDYGVRQALFIHSLQDKRRRRQESENDESD